MNKIFLVVPIPFQGEALQAVLPIKGLTPIIQRDKLTEVKGTADSGAGEYKFHSIDYNLVARILLDGFEHLAHLAEVALAVIEIRKAIGAHGHEEKKESENLNMTVNIQINNQFIYIPPKATKEEIETIIEDKSGIKKEKL